jgi:hypothetical protein
MNGSPLWTHGTMVRLDTSFRLADAISANQGFYTYGEQEFKKF